MNKVIESNTTNELTHCYPDHIDHIDHIKQIVLIKIKLVVKQKLIASTNVTMNNALERLINSIDQIKSYLIEIYKQDFDDIICEFVYDNQEKAT